MEETAYHQALAGAAQVSNEQLLDLLKQIDHNLQRFGLSAIAAVAHEGAERLAGLLMLLGVYSDALECIAKTGSSTVPGTMVDIARRALAITK